MQFPQRDLTNQYISTSYQDVVQRYLTGSTDFLLDGLGYTLLGIPTSSLGGIVLTQDQTASYALTASFAMNGGNASSSISSSYALNADTASYAYTSSYELMTEISSSWASESYHSKIADGAISSSYALFAEMSDTASMSILSEFSDTASLSILSEFSTTSSYSITSSYSSLSINSNTSSYINGLYSTYTKQITNYVANSTDYIIIMSGSYELSCSISTPIQGRIIKIKNISPYNLIVTSSYLMDTSYSQIINQYSSMELAGDGDI